jgi:hypothetical protein
LYEMPEVPEGTPLRDSNRSAWPGAFCPGRVEVLRWLF